MKRYYYEKLSADEIRKVAVRPSINFARVYPVVQNIISDIRANGDTALAAYGVKFGEIKNGESLMVTEAEFDEAEKAISDDLKSAIKTAYNNIYSFHSRQKPAGYSLETMPGVNCSRVWRSIEEVGLYIPGGTAPLPSTVLMLGIPAMIAGCERIVMASPAKNGIIDPVILFTAKLCGIKEFYKTGGAHTIAALAFGTEQIKKVSKIFGPGNQYVTAAKMLVSTDPAGCAIDMPAGPSELLVIADENADPQYVAADLLSQAEHGSDSQVVLVTASEQTADRVLSELKEQIKKLPHREIAEKAIESSLVLITPDYETAVSFANLYAPEHLIINTEDPAALLNKIKNAGSVFLGQFTPESAGDYASGTNHSLPTYGYARVSGGVSVESFMKSMTVQQITENGLMKLGPAVMTLAEAEGLAAHREAVAVRLRKGAVI